LCDSSAQQWGRWGPTSASWVLSLQSMTIGALYTNLEAKQAHL
jgi:hypothetical protein